jgi:perosamine synthetase
MVIPVSRPRIVDDDIRAVEQALRDGYISGDAPIVAEFEQVFAKAVNRKFGIAVSNGSVALDLALVAMDLQVGDEVIVPSFTIASCLFAILKTKATPIFVDVDEQTWNISLKTLQPKISERTKAVILVHTYGLPVDIEPILEFCQQRGIPIIEDAAEAHGVSYNAQPCGSFGLMSTFSFYANKIITCGEGGIIVTDEPELSERLRGLRNLSFLPSPGRRFIHNQIGWNARMSALQAALGKSQLSRIKANVQAKREIGLHYLKLLSQRAELRFQPASTAYAENVFWVFGIELPEGCDSQVIAAELLRLGVDTRPFFYPLHRQPLLKEFSLETSEVLPVSEILGNRGLYLPSYIGISQNEIEQCASSLLSVLRDTSR